jgi:C4-dicarboxylate transporter DctM subunit
VVEALDNDVTFAGMAFVFMGVIVQQTGLIATSSDSAIGRRRGTLSTTVMVMNTARATMPMVISFRQRRHLRRHGLRLHGRDRPADRSDRALDHDLQLDVRPPCPELPATSVAARAGDQPFSFIQGIVTAPTVAALPAVEPPNSTMFIILAAIPAGLGVSGADVYVSLLVTGA